MKQVLNFYTLGSSNSIPLTKEVHGKAFNELSIGTEVLLKTWIVKSIDDFAYIKNVSILDFERGLSENKIFKTKVKSYLSNLGKNNGESIEYNIYPSDFMDMVLDITYTIPIEDDNVIEIEIKGFDGNDGKLEVMDKVFSVHVSQKNNGKKFLVDQSGISIDIRKNLTTAEDVNIFKKIYEHSYIITLSEFLYCLEEAKVEHTMKSLNDLKNTQKERKLLLEKFGLKIRGVNNEN